MRLRTSSVAIAALLAASGCATYVPVAPRTATASGATAKITRVDLRALAVDVELDAHGKTLAAASLATAADVGCNDGLAAKKLRTNDTDATLPLAASDGARRLTVQFDRPKGWALLERGAVLELSLRDANGTACVRVPVNDAAEPRRYRNAAGAHPWWAGEAARIWVPVSRGVTTGGELTFRGGHWFGPFRAGLEAGFGGSFCFSCGPHDILTTPLAAGLDAFLFRFGRGALAVTADYQLRPTWRTFDDGDRFKLVQGVRGGVEISVNGSGLPGFPGGPEQSHLGFAVEVSHWGAAGFETTVVGVGVKLDGPVM